jgi:outer membrane immunogenic protein
VTRSENANEYGHTQTNVSFSGVTTSPIGGPQVENGPLVTNSQSNTPVGWTVGGGLEWMFAPQWSLKGEYLYYDLGSVTLNTVHNFTNLTGDTVNHAANIQSVAHYAGSIARVGVNYKFY